MDLPFKENQETESAAPVESSPEKTNMAPEKEMSGAATATPSFGKSGVKRFFLGVVLGALTIVVLAAIIFGLGIYRFGWSGDIVNKITKVAPYPVAFVNWHPIRFSDYAEDTDTLKIFFDSQGANLGAPLPTDQELKSQVLDRLVKNELSYQLAKRYDIGVSKDEMEEEMEKIIAQDGSRDDVEKTLQDEYGWGIDEFKAKVLKPFLVQQKLQEAISKDETLSQEAKKKAEDVLAEIKKGDRSFEDLAKEYGEDSTAQDGGDLGYFGKGMMVPEFEEAAFALKVGETSRLVLTKYGYHIIRVEEQIRDDNGEVSQVRAGHILIKTKSLDDYLNEETAKAKIWRLIKI